MNLCVEVRKVSSRVAEIGMNLDDIPIPDLIHLHKQKGNILFIELLKTTLKLSMLEVTRSKI